MFLFSSLDKPGDVNSALKNASNRTGVTFDYLETTAKRESNLNPSAKAGTSSATGLFQFIEKTWLSVLKEAGPRHGYGDLANKIQPSASGGYRVTDAKARAQILELREDPKAAALMAGEFTARNAESLRTSLGRPATEGELYAAHFLGAQGAVELVRLIETAPSAPAADRFPAAAASNRSIFYTSRGTPRSASDVYHALVSGYDATPAIPENARYLAFAPGRSSEDHVFHGMFQSEGNGLGPIGKAVAGFWSSFSGTSAFGFSDATRVMNVETVGNSRDVVLTVQGPGSGKTTETAESRQRGLTRIVSRGYGRFADDPSLPTR